MRNTRNANVFSLRPSASGNRNESPFDLSFHFASQVEARPAHLKICACAWTCNFLEQLPQTWHLLFPGHNTNSHLICSAYRPTQKIVNADSEVSRDMSSHLIHDSLTLVAWSCLSDVQVFPHNDRSKLRMASRQAHSSSPFGMFCVMLMRATGACMAQFLCPNEDLS